MYQSKPDFLEDHPELAERLRHIPHNRSLSWVEGDESRSLGVALEVRIRTLVPEADFLAQPAGYLAAVTRSQIIELHEHVMKLAIEAGVELPCGSATHTRPMR